MNRALLMALNLLMFFVRITLIMVVEIRSDDARTRTVGFRALSTGDGGTGRGERYCRNARREEHHRCHHHPSGQQPSPTPRRGERHKIMQMKKHRISGIIGLVVFATSFLICTLTNRIIGKQRTPESSMMARAFSSSAVRPVRILCFGDSLTAGTSPPEFQNFPYAPHLEKALSEREMVPKVEVAVRHMGFPGWTSSNLLEEANGQNGLGTIIRRIQNPSLSLIIILAGTNDLGHLQSAKEISDTVISLHQFCYSEQIPNTIVIGIPSSAYQSFSQEAAEKARQVNVNLKAFCESEPRAVYFPFPFGYEGGDENWSPDGL